MRAISPRQIEPNEAAVVRAALLRAPTERVALSMLREVETLSVLGVCECGCHSLYFRSVTSEDRRVADGVGSLPDGETIGILVWACSEQLSALELVDHMGQGNLPNPESVRAWDEASADAP